MRKVKNTIISFIKYFILGLKYLVGAPFLAIKDNFKVKTKKVKTRNKPKPGEATWEDLIPGSTWESVWGDKFVVKTKYEVYKERYDPNTNYIYIYTYPENDIVATRNKSPWCYKVHIPSKVDSSLLKGFTCVDTEETYKELSKKGGQHD